MCSDLPEARDVKIEAKHERPLGMSNRPRKYTGRVRSGKAP
jgi:hypothetical protein